jgi:hypothetical protein
LLGLGLLTVTGAYAQTSAGFTATCKDGSAFSGASRSGACRGHGGVGSWGSTHAAATPGMQADATPAKLPESTPAAQPAKKSARTTSQTSAASAGQVWVNASSKVYHCQGDRYYGKTKSGAYMSEDAARAAGDRPSGGKTCS